MSDNSSSSVVSIVAIIAILIIVGAALYFIFLRTDGAPQTNIELKAPKVTTPASSGGGSSN